MTTPSPRLQWFLSRIGQRVFRSVNLCDCKHCADVFENGLVIHDHDHAVYMRDMEVEYYQAEVYFDTKEEVEKYKTEK